MSLRASLHRVAQIRVIVSHGRPHPRPATPPAAKTVPPRRSQTPAQRPSTRRSPRSSYSKRNLVCSLMNSQTYDEEPLGGMNYIRQDNKSLSENWSGIGLDHDGLEDEIVVQKRKSQHLMGL